MDDTLEQWATSGPVKENVRRAGLGARWLLAAAGLNAGLLLLVARVDTWLPAPRPRGSPPHTFMADIAYEHLLNLTSIGPRVAGSYSNEVVSVQALVAALRQVAAGASPHNRLELDVHTASGAFTLSFFDGLNNIYRDVTSVVARLSAVGGGGGGSKRTALLINCHYDTVADSPGASDDGAGCAVALETARALAAGAPLPQPLVLLLNGAEENIMQASHAFLTTHRWAKEVRAFINIEACGAGGREVLFQAGPHDPWLVEWYAWRAPSPFASSIAQELFATGIVPADTDFRVFRDFGNLSGLDLAWSSNGYVYHTALDTADRVPRGSLQRTGDNVLALARALLWSGELSSAVDESGVPAYFDVLGLWVVVGRVRASLLAAALAVALAGGALWRSACGAPGTLYMSRRSWCVCVVHCATWSVCGALCGVLCAALAGAVCHAAGARLPYYSRLELLGGLYAAPALSCNWAVMVWWLRAVRRRAGCALLAGGGGGGAAGVLRGAHLALGAALTALCGLCGLRSGFLPLLWTLPPAAADLTATLLKLTDKQRCVLWTVGALLPSLQTWYLCRALLTLFVPVTGRGGSAQLPADVLVGVLTSTLVLGATSWVLPVLVATSGRVARAAVWALCAVGLMTLALVCSGVWWEPYRALSPQRLMVFHVTRLVGQVGQAGQGQRATHHYWVPELDPNTGHTLQHYVPALSAWTRTTSEECRSHVYCGAPYYLPVLGLVPTGYWAAAPPPPPPLAGEGAGDMTLHVVRTQLNDTTHLVRVSMSGGPSHSVVIASPREGGKVRRCGLLEGAVRGAGTWRGRHVYFFTLFAARPRHRGDWTMDLYLEYALPPPPPPASGEWLQLSVAAHGVSGARAAPHAALLRALPAWAAGTGWPVRLLLYTVY